MGPNSTKVDSQWSLLKSGCTEGIGDHFLDFSWHVNAMDLVGFSYMTFEGEGFGGHCDQSNAFKPRISCSKRMVQKRTLPQFQIDVYGWETIPGMLNSLNFMRRRSLEGTALTSLVTGGGGSEATSGCDALKFASLLFRPLPFNPILFL